MVGDGTVDGLGDQRFLRFSNVVEPRSEVHRFAGHGVLLVTGTSGAARHHLTAGDPNVRLERRLQLVAELAHGLMDVAGGADRPFRVVAVGDRRPKDGHDVVADMLVDSAAIALYHPVDGLEKARQEIVNFFRISFVRKFGEAGEIGEQDCDLPQFAGRHGGWRLRRHRLDSRCRCV